MFLSFFTDALFTTTDFYMSMMLLFIVLTLTLILTSHATQLVYTQHVTVQNMATQQAQHSSAPFIYNADVKSWLVLTFKRSAQPDDEADSSYS
ncbi:MAG TPA: hypothetical protein VIR26_05225 [Metalysinibacillus sp.]